MDSGIENVCDQRVALKENKVSIIESVNGVSVIRYVCDESVRCDSSEYEENAELKNDDSTGAVNGVLDGWIEAADDNGNINETEGNEVGFDENEYGKIDVNNDIGSNNGNIDETEAYDGGFEEHEYRDISMNDDSDDDNNSDEKYGNDDSGSSKKGDKNCESDESDEDDESSDNEMYEEYDTDENDRAETINSRTRQYKGSRLNKKNITFEQRVLIRKFYVFMKKLKTDLVQMGSQPIMKKYGNVMDTCAAVCDISRGTVAAIVRENNNEIKTRKAKSPTYLCNEENITTIKKTVLDFYVRKQYPNLNKILAACKKVPDFPEISRSTLCRWMRDECNLKHKPIGKKPIFLERQDVKQQRTHYLNAIQKYREEGYYVVYTDETWASPDLAPSQCWQLLLKGAEITDFLEYTTDKVLQNVDGYTGGFIVKGGQGRVIINHAGGAKGFVSGEGVEDIFISKKDSADYHSSMNAEHFNNWFKKLVASVDDKTVIVLDRAPYHRDRVPSTVMCKMYQNKDKLIESLLLRKIQKPEGVNDYKTLTKKQLMAWSEKHPVKVKYEIERIAEASGKDVRILWLPVAHCELNPIELIWSVVKGYVAKNNSIGGTKRVKELSLEAIRSVTQIVWKNCCDHAIKEEDKMRERDRLLDSAAIAAEIGEPLENLEI